MPTPQLILITTDALRRDALGCYSNPAAATPHLDRIAREGIRFEQAYTTSPDPQSSRRHLLDPHTTGTPFPQRLADHGYTPATLTSPNPADTLATHLADTHGPLAIHIQLPAPEAITDYPLDAIDATRVKTPLSIPHALENRPAALRHDAAQHPSLSPDELHHLRHTYLAQVHTLDTRVGEILTVLEAAGSLHDTLIAITATGGRMLGDHDIVHRQSCFYDPNLCVPLLLRWPQAIPGGQQTYALAQADDAVSTLLHAAGIETATSLLPIARGERTLGRDTVAAMQYPGPNRWTAMLRQHDHKLILYHSPHHDHLEGELFDLEHDWHELNSLWSMPEYWGIRLSLTEHLLHYIATHPR